MIEQADAIGLFGLNDARSEQQLLGLRPADLAAERPSCVDPPVRCCEEAKAGTLTPDPYVERRGEHGSAAVGEAVYHANDRLGADGNLKGASGIAHAILLFAAVALVVLHLFLDIATGRERLVTGTGDDEAADRVVGVEHFYRVEQLAAELAVHGVEDFWPVERDDADAVLPLDHDVLVCRQLDPPLLIPAIRAVLGTNPSELCLLMPAAP